MATIEYKTQKWFNIKTSNLLNNTEYHEIDFQKNDKNINVNIFKTDIQPKFMIIPEKELTTADNIKMLTEYLKTNLKKTKNKTEEKILITRIIKKSNEFDTVIRTKKLYLDLNDKQKSIIKNWIHHCKDLYNICIDKHTADSTFFNKGYKTIKKKLFNSIYKKSKKPVPYDILTDEVRVFCSNLKSCFTNIRNKNITHFKIKKKLKLKTNYSLLIPYKSIQKTGFYKTLFGKIKNFDLYELPTHDCRLFYNYRNDTFSLNIPTNIYVKKIINRESICAIDPGEKKFISFYGSQSYGSIGDDIRIPLLKIRNKIKRYQKVLNKGLNNAGNDIKNKNQIKTKIRKLYKKSKNIVKELHNQSANYLCKNYDNILIPKFETQKMISSKEEFKKYKLEFINNGTTNEERKCKKVYKKM